MNDRRSIAAALMALGLLMAASVAQADTQDIIQPQGQTQTKRTRLATCERCNRDRRPRQTARRKPHCISSTRPAGTRRSGSRSTSSSTNRLPSLPSPPFPPGSILAPINPPESKNRTIKTLRVDLPPGLDGQSRGDGCEVLARRLRRTRGRGNRARRDRQTTQLPRCVANRPGENHLVANNNEVEIQPGFKPPTGFVGAAEARRTGPKCRSSTSSRRQENRRNSGSSSGRDDAEVFLETEVAWESDFHESFTIKLPDTAPKRTGLSTLISRLDQQRPCRRRDLHQQPDHLLRSRTQRGPNTLYSTWFRAESHGEPNPNFPQSARLRSRRSSRRSRERISRKIARRSPSIRRSTFSLAPTRSTRRHRRR